MKEILFADFLVDTYGGIGIVYRIHIYIDSNISSDARIQIRSRKISSSSVMAYI